MKMRAVACSMLEDEITLAMECEGIAIPVDYLDRQLHERPEDLRREVQRRVSAIQDAQVVLLALGLCGNGLAGIASEHATLVAPRYADCIHMLREPAGSVLPDHLYFTRGWLNSERHLGREYDCALARYGHELTRQVYGQMLRHYRGISLIDTGAYELEPCRQEVADLARRLNLEPGVVAGSVDVLRKLFGGRWDEDFIVLPPGRAIALADYGLPG